MGLYDRFLDTSIGNRFLAVYLPATFFSFVVFAKLFSLVEAASSRDSTRLVQMVEDFLACVFFVTFLVLVGVRLPVKRRLASPWAALAALGGSFSLSVVPFAPITVTDLRVVGIGAVLVIAGVLWSIVSMVTLGRCFGILPEVRGLVTRGPYRLVRHPVYLGEIVGAIGLVLPVFSTWTVLVLGVFIALQLWRTHYEEAALSATFPAEYAAYANRTRRLIPRVW